MAKFDEESFVVEVFVGKKNFFKSPEIVEYVDGEGCNNKEEIVQKALKQSSRNLRTYRAVVELL